jgi:hypothetical protein
MFNAEGEMERIISDLERERMRNGENTDFSGHLELCAAPHADLAQGRMQPKPERLFFSYSVQTPVRTLG